MLIDSFLLRPYRTAFQASARLRMEVEVEASAVTWAWESVSRLRKHNFNIWTHFKITLIFNQYLTQNNVDQAILHQCHEHENCTNRHKRIDSFQIWDRRQTRLWFRMLRRKGEEWSDAKCDTSRRSFRLYPERDPRHYDDETRWNVSVK